MDPGLDEGSNDYVIRVHDDPAAIDAAAWNALLAAQAAATPFMRHEYLLALHASGSAVAGDRLDAAVPRRATTASGCVAACPLYLKDHSYGEYVFDWAWADAYQRHGLRLLPEAARRRAVHAGARPAAAGARRRRPRACCCARCASWRAQDEPVVGAPALHRRGRPRGRARPGWMMRSTRAVPLDATATPQPYADFADFLASLQREKRKKIQQERRRVARGRRRASTALEGARDRRGATGTSSTAATRCTYRAHHSTPYLTRDFFARMARDDAASTG